MIKTETNDKSKCPGGLSKSLDLCAKIDEGSQKLNTVLNQISCTRLRNT